MSLVEKPHIKDYWSTNPVLYTPFASSLMKRDRFTSIFSSNSKYVSKGHPGHDSLFKIRSYVNFINTQMPKFEIYSEKGQLDNSITSLYERFLCDYFEKGYTIYMDRFYTSPLVLKFLWEKKQMALVQLWQTAKVRNDVC